MAKRKGKFTPDKDPKRATRPSEANVNKMTGKVLAGGKPAKGTRPAMKRAINERVTEVKKMAKRKDFTGTMAKVTLHEAKRARWIKSMTDEVKKAGK